MKTRKDYYTVSEAAEVLGIAIPTMYVWARTKEDFKAFKNPVTGNLMIPKAPVDKLGKSLKEWG